MRTVYATVFIALLTARVGQAQTPPAPPPTPEQNIVVSEVDVAAWEKYQLLSRLSESQLQGMQLQLEKTRLQNEKTLAEEWTKLDQRFLQNYHLHVNEIERRGDQWIPRRAPTPPATPK